MFIPKPSELLEGCYVENNVKEQIDAPERLDQDHVDLTVEQAIGHLEVRLAPPPFIANTDTAVQHWSKNTCAVPTALGAYVCHGIYPALVGRHRTQTLVTRRVLLQKKGVQIMRRNENARDFFVTQQRVSELN